MHQKIYLHLFLTFFIINLTACAPEQTGSARERIDFTKNWAFHLGDAANAETPDFDDSDWRKLNVPHDWSIEGAFDKNNPAGVGGGALPGGVGWYRKSFTLNESDSSKLFFIDFDGVYQDSEVWINGQFLGKRPNGYISFRYELTPHLHFGDAENIIAVKVDNSQQPNSRWYSGSGIYRNVWLVKTNPVYVDQWGTFVTTPEVTKAEAKVHVNVKIRNRNNNREDFDSYRYPKPSGKGGGKNHHKRFANAGYPQHD